MRREKLSFEEFRRELAVDFQKDRHMQFLAFRTSNKKPAGTIWSYSYGRRDEYCFISTYIHPIYKNRGYGAELFSQFLRYLLDTFDIFKVYTDVYGNNKSSLDVLIKAGFQIEGVFRGHRLFDGARIDLVRLAFFTEQKNKLTDFLKPFKTLERR